MRIDSLHGFFQFREDRAGELAEFARVFGIDTLNLVAVDDYFTFEALSLAPAYAINTGTYLGAQAKKTFSGKPWEIMRENDLVFDLSLGRVVNFLTVTNRIDLSQSDSYFISSGLINPGSMADDKRVLSYKGFYSFGSGRFRYSEVERV